MTIKYYLVAKGYKTRLKSVLKSLVSSMKRGEFEAAHELFSLYETLACGVPCGVLIQGCRFAILDPNIELEYDFEEYKKWIEEKSKKYLIISDLSEKFSAAEYVRLIDSTMKKDESGEFVYPTVNETYGSRGLTNQVLDKNGYAFYVNNEIK